MLDIIDAQLALSTAQLNYISAQYDYARYKAEVENAMGLGIGSGKAAAATTGSVAGNTAGRAQTESAAAMNAAANGVS